MSNVLHTRSAETEKHFANRKAKIALVLCLVTLGTVVEARAECQDIRGSITEIHIPSNDPFGRFLGNVTGVLNGASTSFATSLNPVTSQDVFWTHQGDMLTATGAPTRTPVPGKPGEFIVHVDLTITGGSGKYAGATGWMTFDGLSHPGAPGVGTADLIYRGSVCGPNIKADGN